MAGGEAPDLIESGGDPLGSDQKRGASGHGGRDESPSEKVFRTECKHDLNSSGNRRIMVVERITPPLGQVHPRRTDMGRQ